VQPVPVRHHHVDERRGHVDAAVGGLEHPLDQVADVVGGQDGGGQLVPAVAGDEDAVGLVDPDLLGCDALTWSPGSRHVRAPSGRRGAMGRRRPGAYLFGTRGR
jgi:hypothetical protein